MVIATTPLIDQSKSGPIISFLTFEEPSPHICGDGAGAVWQSNPHRGLLAISLRQHHPGSG